jgi:hypothetical protein
VTWLLRRLSRFGRARGPLVCYLRENGPIAYASAVFASDPRERASALLATDLAWYWRTIGSGAGVREWTLLTAWSLAALLADVGDASALPTPLVLIGIDGGDAPSEVDDACAAQWIRRFDGGADRPLHAVIARQPPDPELLFVAQHPPDAILQLLQAWGIDRDRADRQAYPRLRERSLEALARSLSSRGDPGVRS